MTDKVTDKIADGIADRIRVYGTTWCPDCARSKKCLDRNGISYEWINIEQDAQARDYVVQINHGNRSVPTILFPDGTVLVEPSDSELEKRLGVRKPNNHP